MEPLRGFEPRTYSFTSYRHFAKIRLISGLDCILDILVITNLVSLVSRSGVSD